MYFRPAITWKSHWIGLLGVDLLPFLIFHSENFTLSKKKPQVFDDFLGWENQNVRFIYKNKLLVLYLNYPLIDFRVRTMQNQDWEGCLVVRTKVVCTIRKKYGGQSTCSRCWVSWYLRVLCAGIYEIRKWTWISN